MDWLLWAPLAAATLHITEEFGVPGGFPAWYRQYRPNPSRISTRFLILINAGLLVTCLDIALAGRRAHGVLVVWLAIAAILASNGVWHLWASFRSHHYSPGVVTGIVLYLPMAVYGYFEFLRSGDVDGWSALGAAVLGCSYQLWSAAYHRGGTRKSLNHSSPEL